MGARQRGLALTGLGALLALSAHRLLLLHSKDPCEANPGAYACAIFSRPAWLTRSVNNGQMGNPSVQASVPAPINVPVSGGMVLVVPVESAADPGMADQSPDGV